MIFVRRLTKSEVTQTNNLPKSTELDKDTQVMITDAGNSNVVVCSAICTHLGCSPLYYREDDPHPLGADWRGGFFCPCHGSRFDMAGRVYKGVPAPSNMEVPPHQFLTDTRVVVGASAEAA